VVYCRRVRLKLEPGWNKKLFSAGCLLNVCRMLCTQLCADAEFFGITWNAWKIVGFTGSLVFGLRFLIQWLASERARKSVIPVGFWECSAVGSLLTLLYFAVYRHDSVGVLQTALPLPIYLRNLYFRYSHHETKHPGAEPRLEE
jgi:lipid-A-disaccharide synthase-like uncharacterized protein